MGLLVLSGVLRMDSRAMLGRRCFVLRKHYLLLCGVEDCSKKSRRRCLP